MARMQSWKTAPCVGSRKYSSIVYSAEFPKFKRPVLITPMTQFELRINSSVKKVLLIFHEHGKVGLNINTANEIRVKG